MTIIIRNDKGEKITFIEIKNGVVVEETLKGCYHTDTNMNDDGSLCYRLDLIDSVDIKSLSNQTLLEEIHNRMK